MKATERKYLRAAIAAITVAGMAAFLYVGARWSINLSPSAPWYIGMIPWAIASIVALMIALWGLKAWKKAGLPKKDQIQGFSVTGTFIQRTDEFGNALSPFERLGDQDVELRIRGKLKTDPPRGVAAAVTKVASDIAFSQGMTATGIEFRDQTDKILNDNGDDADLDALQGQGTISKQPDPDELDRMAADMIEEDDVDLSRFLAEVRAYVQIVRNSGAAVPAYHETLLRMATIVETKAAVGPDPEDPGRIARVIRSHNDIDAFMKAMVDRGYNGTVQTFLTVGRKMMFAAVFTPPYDLELENRSRQVLDALSRTYYNVDGRQS